MARRTLRLRGLRVAVEVAGEGPAVLLLHGFPDSAALWRHQVAALADAGYRAIAPDLRGFGGTDRPLDVAGYRMPNLVADALALLDALGEREAHVVGHDWGAALAWALALEAPDRVRTLTVLSVGHGGPHARAGVRQRLRSSYMLWFSLPQVAERTIPAFGWAGFRVSAWGGASPGQDADADRQVADLSRPGALRAGLTWYRANAGGVRFLLTGRRGDTGMRRRQVVTCPVLAVWSDGDPFLGERQLLDSAAYVAGPWRYERLSGVDHWIPVHAQDRLNALLLDFLRATWPSPPVVATAGSTVSRATPLPPP